MRTALIILAILPPLAAAAEEPIAYGRGQPIAELANRDICESSGIACSRLTPDAFWTHNDSGSGPILYAFDRSGRDLGVFAVAASCRDWEDIASVTLRGRALLVIGDVGDNHGKRQDCCIHVAEEPPLTPAGSSRPQLRAQSFPFRYPDGLHNCEALGVDATSGVIYLVTKVKGGGACAAYELVTPLAQPDARPPFIATKLAELDIPTVTAMDIAPDGRRAVVLTYANALEYTRTQDGTWAQAFAAKPRVLQVPRGPQSEAICYGADGKTLFLTSETNKKDQARPCPLFELPVASAQR